MDANAEIEPDFDPDVVVCVVKIHLARRLVEDCEECKDAATEALVGMISAAAYKATAKALKERFA